MKLFLLKTVYDKRRKKATGNSGEQESYFFLYKGERLFYNENKSWEGRGCVWRQNRKAAALPVIDPQSCLGDIGKKIPDVIF
jgi:hypothetical protein